MRKVWIKVILSILFLFIGYIVTQMIVSFMYYLFPVLIEVIPRPFQSLIMKLTPIPPAILLWHFIEHKPISKMGLSFHGGAKHFLSGSILGLLSTTIIVLFLYLFGIIELDSTEAMSNYGFYILSAILYNLGTALGEEIMFRGYITGILNRFQNAYVVFFMPSAIFSLLHFFNSGFNIVGAVNTFLVGVLFTYMSYKTGSLWMAIGYHALWNWSLSDLYNLNMSGGGSGDGIIKFIPIKESILGTLSYGPEGGLLCTFLLIAILLCMRYFCHKKDTGDSMEFPQLPVFMK